MIDAKTAAAAIAPTVQNPDLEGRASAVLMHCDTAPFDPVNQWLALKYAIDREAMLEADPGRLRLDRGTISGEPAYALFPEGLEQRVYDPEKAKFHYQKSAIPAPSTFAPRTRPSARSMPRCCSSRTPPRPASRSRPPRTRRRLLDQCLNVQPFCASPLGRASDAGSALSDELSISTAEMERHPLQAPGIRQAGA